MTGWIFFSHFQLFDGRSSRCYELPKLYGTVTHGSQNSSTKDKHIPFTFHIFSCECAWNELKIGMKRAKQNIDQHFNRNRYKVSFWLINLRFSWLQGKNTTKLIGSKAYTGQLFTRNAITHTLTLALTHTLTFNIHTILFWRYKFFSVWISFQFGLCTTLGSSSAAFRLSPKNKENKWVAKHLCLDVVYVYYCWWQHF